MDEKSGGMHAVTFGDFCAGGCCERGKEAWQVITKRWKGQTSDVIIQ